MAPLKRLKTVLLFIKVRPLPFAATLILLLDILYVNLFYAWPNAEFQKDSGQISGIVKEKVLDEEGKLKSIVVGNTLCYVNKAKDHSYISVGSKVSVKGSMSAFEGPMNKGEFNKKEYYASMHLFYVMYAEKLYVEYTPAFNLKEVAFRIKSYCVSAIKRYMPLEYGTVNTLLFAEKSGLSEERRDLYSRVGVAHFLVISGLHVSALGSFVYHFFNRIFVKRKLSCVMALLVLLTYGTLAGFSVSVIRALIMFAVRLFADFVKRIYDMMNALSVALIINCIINPLSILNSAFSYSYMTVFAISVYITYIQPNPLRTDSFVRKLREAVRIPFILCLFMLPLTLKLSGRFSLASIGINGVLTPISPVFLVASFAGFFLSLFKCETLALGTDRLMSILLGLLDRLCRSADYFSGLKLRGEPGNTVMISYYCILFFYFIWVRKQGGLYVRALTLAGIMLFSLNSIKMGPQISMLYVGQGECIVIQTDCNNAFIVDCGSSSETDIVKYRVLPFIRSQGINHIKGIFFTHSDRDHMGEGIELIDGLIKDGIKVENVFLPGLNEECKDDTYRQIEALAKEKHILHYVNQNALISINGSSFKVLWPDIKRLTGDSNGDSLVMLYSYGSFELLLTGDATAETEEIIAGEVGDVEVLKVSHHGSRTATSKVMLTQIAPEAAIISAGKNNIYHHPSTVVTERLSEGGIYYKCTKDAGEVDITINTNGFRITSMIK